MDNMRIKALKEYASQHTQALYNLTLYGYYHNLSGDHESEKEHYITCYFIHNQAAAAIQRILSIRDNKYIIPKINTSCEEESLKQYENFLKNNKGSDNK